MKLHLVPDWRQSWTWYSQQAKALSAGLLATWLALPVSLQAVVPLHAVLVMVIAILVLGMLGRIVDQGSTVAPIASDKAARDAASVPPSPLSNPDKGDSP